MFIVISGMDGAGKTTQAALLAAALRSAGRDVLLTSQPGGTALGRIIRPIVLEKTAYSTPKAELMLFLADRAEHVASVIEPALRAGQIVVCDRYVESTLAYQSPRLGPGAAEAIMEIHRFMGWPLPDLQIFLDTPANTAAARIAARGSSDVDPDLEELRRLQEAYLATCRLAARETIFIDGAAAQERVAERISQAVVKRLTAQSFSAMA